MPSHSRTEIRGHASFVFTRLCRLCGLQSPLAIGSMLSLVLGIFVVRAGFHHAVHCSCLGLPQGLVRVRQKIHWDLVLSDKAFNQAIKCIAFDERQGDAWIGDEGGHVKVS